SPPDPSLIAPLSLHDALPIYRRSVTPASTTNRKTTFSSYCTAVTPACTRRATATRAWRIARSSSTNFGSPTHRRRRRTWKRSPRSEEHTSELQSLAYLVCRLL